MAFFPPVVGYLLKKALQKGGEGLWAPQDTPSYAFATIYLKDRSQALVINF